MDRNEIVELLGAQSEQIRTGFGVRRLSLLQNLLGCPVDLVTTKGVKPAMYRVVAEEAIRVA